MNSAVLTSTPLVVFVGAGASSIPPSSLPGWIDFNTTLLECLCEQVSIYSKGRQPVEPILAAITAQRDRTPRFPPDFQAQLMEEEIGADYFRVWQSLDTTVCNPVHRALAELAARKGIAAIVTTNFDRLIEVALAERGVAHTVHHDAPGFDALTEALARDAASREAAPRPALPVIKIHGSIEDAASLVDTLRQRLMGRPPALMSALRALLREHHWLFLGFSGADFSYDPHYLGVLDAAAEARGFTFVSRHGAPVQPGVLALVNEYGGKGEIVQGDLPQWLHDTFGLPPAPLPEAGAGASPVSPPEIRERMTAWVTSLGPLATVNMLCAMLRSIGLDDHAHWLLRRTWRRYRTPQDTTAGASYDRYNHNYGLALLEFGFVGNAVQRAEDLSNLLEWRDAADQDAWQFFGRAYRRGTLFAAGAHHAACTAYLGNVGEALRLADDVVRRAHAAGSPLACVDTWLALAPLQDMANRWGDLIAPLSACVTLAHSLGDEPRRAQALVQLARAHCVTGRFDDAYEALHEAQRIAARLALPQVALQCRLVHGRLVLDSEESDEMAMHMLQEVVNELHARAAEPLYTHADLSEPSAPPTVVTGTPPLLCRALLDLNRAARFAGSADVMNATLRELHDLTATRFPGYAAHVVVAHGQCLLHHGVEADWNVVATCIQDLQSLYEQSGNPWAATGAQLLADALAQSTRNASVT